METTTISAEQARGDDPGRDRDAGLRRLAMSSPLELKIDFAYWNPNPVEEPAPGAEQGAGAEQGSG